MKPIFIVAGEEFKDHITSKRFLAILAIFMLLAVYAMVTGMDGYNKTLDYYKKDASSNNPYRQENHQQHAETDTGRRGPGSTGGRDTKPERQPGVLYEPAHALGAAGIHELHAPVLDHRA